MSGRLGVDTGTTLTCRYRTLKPGGWIELQDYRFIITCDDDSMKEDDPVAEWLVNIKKALAVFGVDLLAMGENPGNSLAAGFVNVGEKSLKVPLGVWPRDQKMKTAGLYNRCIALDGLQGIMSDPSRVGSGGRRRKLSSTWSA